MEKKAFVTKEMIEKKKKKYPTPFHIYDEKGCKTVFDVAPAYLSTLTPEEMRSALL